MDRPDLELVLAVRQHGSLVMAARALRVAPSAVTKRLAALEADLGLRLFQRTTRRVSPTAEGDTLCDRAADLLRAFDEVEAELRERQAEPAGRWHHKPAQVGPLEGRDRRAAGRAKGHRSERPERRGGGLSAA